MDIYSEVERFYQSISTQKTIIGKSLFGRNIYAVKMGDGFPVGICQYAIHGREFITSKLALNHFLRGGFGSVWFIPLTNPDGALLSQIGIQSVPKQYQDFLLSINGGEDFSLWKANGRGVDLNVNFDADFGKGVQNVKQAGSENYIGTNPFSEPETLALKNFTLEVKPNYSFSFHTKGEEIYWYYHQKEPDLSRDKTLAQIIQKVTSYPLKQTLGSVGGYKDWCIQKLKIPSFTLEVGQDDYAHPLGGEALPNILAKNIDVVYQFSKEYRSYEAND